MMKGWAEKKIPGEKLVCVDVVYTDKIESIRITGDFFIHPESCIIEIERALSGIPLSMNDMELEGIIQGASEAGGAKLIGISPKGIVAALRAATTGGF